MIGYGLEKKLPEAINKTVYTLSYGLIERGHEVLFITFGGKNK